MRPRFPRLKGKTAFASALAKATLRSMDSSAFVRIEREAPGGVRHYVVHAHDPQFSLELSPDDAAPDRRGRGVLRRLSVPNSWASDYTRYARLVSAAQEFFAQSLEEPAPKAESRRWVR